MDAENSGWQPPPIPEKIKADQEQPQMSEAATLGGIFFEPGKTFEDLRRKPRFLIAGLLIIIAFSVFNVLVIEKVGLDRITRARIESSSSASQMPSDQKEKMIEQQSGSVITQASTGGLVGVAGIASYSAAKGGVIALTRQVAVEYGRLNIRANTICPGTVPTPLVTKTFEERGLDDGTLVDAARGYPLKRLGTPDEIAALALFLASDEASWITGGTFTADGGYTAR